jgi:DNA-binding CsgD family transcriptional regulator
MSDHDPVVDVEPPIAADMLPRARARAPQLDVWPMLTRFVDALPEEGLLCNARGRVLHANASARRRLSSPRDAGRLQDAVLQACAALPAASRAREVGRADGGHVPRPVQQSVTLGGRTLELRAIDLGRGVDGSTWTVLVLLRAEWPASSDHTDALSSRRLHRFHITPTEGVIARMLAARQTDGEIATALGSSVRTVQNHVQHILGKLGVHTRRAVGPVLGSTSDTPPAPTRHSPPDA